MNRRDFLALASALPVALLAPRLSAEPLGGGGRVLVLVQLAGGNDGLNTVIPFADPAYRAARPSLAVGRDQALHLTERVGLHPGLDPLMKPWKDGRLAVVQGVGYDAPNRSHFRSIEIWETASDSEEVLASGWLDTVLARAKGEPPTAVVLGNEDTGPTEGAGLRTLVMSSPQEFIASARRMPTGSRATANPALAHILRVQDDIRLSAEAMARALKDAPALGLDFPAGPLGRQLEVAASLLVAGLPLAVIKVVHNGYDTHAGQRGPHDRLMGELGQALATFQACMTRHGRWNDVLMMTYSEFGRRVAENGSGGTDHGTAAPHLVLGGRVKGGLYGAQPSLTATSAGDLVHTVDFRQLYATVSDRWWSRPTAFSGERFKPLGFLTA